MVGRRLEPADRREVGAVADPARDARSPPRLAIDVDASPRALFAGERQNFEEMLANLMDSACRFAASRISICAAAVLLSEGSQAVGRTLSDLRLDGVVVTALTRGGRRELTPASEVRLGSGDVLVPFGTPEDLERAERELLG